MAKIKIERLMKLVTMFFILVIVVAAVWTFVAKPYMDGQGFGLNVDNNFIDNSPDDDGVPDNQDAFSGKIQVNFDFLNHANDDAVYETANGTGKIYHADGTSLLGVMSAAGVITGQVKDSDNGQLYLLWQPASTVYFDAAFTTAQSAELGAVTSKQIEGVKYYWFPLDVSDLNQVEGLTTELDINMYLYVADVSGIDYSSSTNATSADYSGTAWISASVDGRITGMTQETAFKITKVEISLPDAANISLLDNSHIKNLKVTLGMGSGQPDLVLTEYTHNTGGTYIEFDIGVDDPTQEYEGLPVIYGTNDSTADIDYVITANLSGFTASDVLVPSLIITYIGPNGATGTFTVGASFTDS